MTTDMIQDKKLRMKARITDTSNYRKRYDSHTDKGLELTRMQSFLDGGHDIFDVLEDHAANGQMKIRAKKANDADLNLKMDEELRHTPLFQSLLTRLREQMREMI